ncbi:hypothetical protein LPJ66_003947 [Kickxella alabastrina]|uniref:Uncharacterized protein n=1 Tax=Kickxella alabastrina TaxID=61397 RepID=A0ACC1IMD9_9FUNG|nr:hypothetical protein LPJ66_003947 [Kickxella alabastrina]
MQLFSFTTLALVAVFATAVVRADAYADALAEAEAAPEAIAEPQGGFGSWRWQQCNWRCRGRWDYQQCMRWCLF